MRLVDGWLKNNKFLGSNEVSISDVSLASNLRYAFRLIFDEKNRTNLPNLTKWFEEVSNLQPFQQHFGKLWLCTKEFIPEFAGSQPVVAAEEKKPKEQKEQKEQKKPAEKKPAEKKK